MLITNNQLVDIIDSVSSSVFYYESQFINDVPECTFYYLLNLKVNDCTTYHFYRGPINQRLMNDILNSLECDYENIEHTITKLTQEEYERFST